MICFVSFILLFIHHLLLVNGRNANDMSTWKLCSTRHLLLNHQKQRQNQEEYDDNCSCFTPVQQQQQQRHRRIWRQRRDERFCFLLTPPTSFLNNNNGNKKNRIVVKNHIIDTNHIFKSRIASTKINKKRFLLLLSQSNDHIENEYDDQYDESQLRSITFWNLPKDQEPDVLCDYLLELGACSASIVDSDRGTNLEQPIFDEPNARTTNPGLSIIMSTTTVLPIWNRCNVIAHFPSSINIQFVFDMISNTPFIHTQISLDDHDDREKNDDPNNNNDVNNSRDTNTDNNVIDRDKIQIIDGNNNISYSIEQVLNQDWILHVQKSWKPIIVANQFLLRFPWHNNDTTLRNNITSLYPHMNYNDLVPIKLQGGIAFGTGEHPTTQLCLEWLKDIINMKFQSFQSTTINSNNNNTIYVLDYGSGSGILGLCACALSRQYNSNNSNSTSQVHVEAIGIDIDIDACRIGNANARINDNLPMRTYLPSLSQYITDSDNDENNSADNESKSVLMKSEQRMTSSKNINKNTNNNDDGVYDTNDDDIVELLPSYYENEILYDICVANILAQPLITLIPTIGQMIQSPNGVFGVSGILKHQGPMMIHELVSSQLFHSIQIVNEKDDWIIITGIRR